MSGLYGLERQEALAIAQAQLVLWEGFRRQMLNFAHQRELGPVPNAYNHILGLTMQLGEAREADQVTLNLNPSMNNTHKHHNHLNSDPEPCE